MIRAVVCYGKLAAIIVSILLFFAGRSDAAPQIYCTTNDGLSLAAIDTTTATGTVVGPFGNVAMGLAIDNTDGTFYTIVDSGLGSSGPRPTEQLAIVNPVTGATTRVGQPFSYWITMATAIPALEVGNDGDVYAGGVDGTFYRIDKTTGQPTLLGSQSIIMVMDYAFDSQGTLWAVAGTKNDLYTVNPSTGAATYVKKISGITSIGSGVMGIMFDENDVMYATNIASYPDAHLYMIDITAGTATDLGVLNLDQPHGGDIYLPVNRCIQPPSDLISWWPGDGNAGDITETNNGALMNGATFTNGRVRQAFSFDGIDDYVEITSGAFDFGNASFSIDFWIYSNTNGANTYILGKSLPDGGKGFDVRLDSNTIQVIGVNGWGINIVSDASITPNNWHHIAVSSTDTTVDLYIDSVLKGSSTRQYINTTANPFRIGYTTNFGVTAFNGLIDEVDIFNRALTSSEIADIYNSGKAGKCLPGCTDNDSDTYATEGGICGPVDCNDNNPVINPGGTDTTCNGIDENCSGSADEGYVPTTTTCGVGECTRTGQNVCQNGQIANTCTPGQPQTEGPAGNPTCTDSKDNDCDGTTDSLDTNCQTLNADLYIYSIIVPSTVTPGSNITVIDTTKNNGTGTAGASTTKLYWSANSTYDTGDTELGSRSVPSLAAGASSAGSTTVTIPAGTCSGSYYIIARADANNAVLETKETNNTSYKVINIGPDLIVSALTGPSTAGAGQTISVSDTTRNNGGCTAGEATTKLYWSANSTYDAGDTELGSRSVPSLAAGASSAGSTTVTIPAGTCSGSYYIIARADTDNAVLEITETNNTSSKVINIGPDLIVSALTGPSTAGAGQTISVSDTTRNNGGCTAGEATTKLYWSANSTYDVGDTELGSRSVPSLAAGIASAGIMSVSTPADASTGTYYIIARADAGSIVPETIETNNTKSWTIKIGPDLIVSALTAPSTAGEGQTISVTDTTKNNGAGAAGASITKLYWSANSAYDAGDTELGSRSVPSLAAGASSAGSTTVTIPSGTTSGTYYIIARTDADSIVPETSETNNTLYRSIIIGIAGPDLIVSALTAPSTAGEGQAISVTDTTKNNGAGTAGASTTKLYWSVNSAYDAGDTELGSRSVPSLAAGASSAGSTTVTIPSGTTSGTYYIIARTDADSIVPETSETNNTINRFIAIGTVLPDLTIPYISAPASATAGSSIDVTDVTRNIGAVTSGASTTRLYLSADTVLNAGDIELAGRAVPSLVSFGFSNMVTQVTIPANTSSGTYYIIVVSDADGVIAETNEANNSNYKAIVINP